MKDNPYRILAVIVLLGFVLRMHGIGALEFWYDEIDLWLYSLGAGPSTQEPPLMSWILYAVMKWMNSADPTIMHVIPAIFGTLTIPLAFILVRQLDGTRVAGLVASILVAISPMMLYFSREGRPYALFIFLSGCLLISFINAQKRNGWIDWLAYSFMLLLSCLAHQLQQPTERSTGAPGSLIAS